MQLIHRNVDNKTLMQKYLYVLTLYFTTPKKSCFLKLFSVNSLEIIWILFWCKTCLKKIIFLILKYTLIIFLIITSTMIIEFIFRARTRLSDSSRTNLNRLFLEIRAWFDTNEELKASPKTSNYHYKYIFKNQHVLHN